MLDNRQAFDELAVIVGVLWKQDNRVGSVTSTSIIRLADNNVEFAYMTRKMSQYHATSHHLPLIASQRGDRRICILTVWVRGSRNPVFATVKYIVFAIQSLCHLETQVLSTHFQMSYLLLFHLERAQVKLTVASDDATSGSVMVKADRILASIRGSNHCFFCSSVPYLANSSMLPVSGAYVLWHHLSNPFGYKTLM